MLRQASELDAWHVEWSEAERLAWAPPEMISVSEWADKHRVLSRQTAEPGPWRTERTPYLREIMDAFADPFIEQITVCKSTQVGGTEAFHNVLAWAVDQDPRPMMLVVPRQTPDVGERFTRRLQPMFEDSPALARHLTGWKSDWKTQEIGFDRCVLYGRGSNSPADLASIAVGLLIGDEADKWPGFSGKESKPWDLAKERTRTFHRRKIGLVSTPTTTDGLIWKEFQGGDRRRYWIPCPHCAAFQVLAWAQVRWNEKLEHDPRRLKRERAAWYECERCAGKIEDLHKREYLARGVWVPEGAELVDGEVRGAPITDHRSYHIWAGYSPWLTWAEIAAAYLEMIGDRLINFITGWLGEPFSETVAETTEEGVASKVRLYARNTVPSDEARVLTMGVDVQKVGIPYALRAWGLEGESWLVRAGELRAWESLEEIMLAEWGNGLRVGCVAIDARWRTEEVFEFARRFPEIVRAIKGVQRQGPVPFTTSKIDRHPITGRAYRNSLLVWNVDVDIFRDELAARIEGEDEGPRAWHVHADVGPAYIKQLSSNEKVIPRAQRTTKRKAVWRMKKGHRVDDLFDCEVYNLVAAAILRADRIGRPRQPGGGPGGRPSEIKRRVRTENAYLAEVAGRGGIRER